MELRYYWSVIWRHKWLALLAGLLTFAASFTIQTREPVSYVSTVRLALLPGLTEASTSSSMAEQQYYEYLAAEYLNDDVMKVVEGGAFKSEVASRASAALGRPASGSIRSEKAHKLMLFTVTADDEAQAKALGEAIAAMLTGPRADIFGKFFSNDANVSLVDEIRTERAVPASREYLFMLARVLLAVFAALALAFLLEYLDDTVPGGAALEKVVGLPLLAEIPGASDGRGGRGGSLS